MKTRQFNHVWDAIADSPAEAANLKTRTELMHQLITILKGKDWKITDVAKYCGVTQPRLDELLHGQIAKFTLDELVSIAVVIGMQVNIRLEEDIDAAFQRISRSHFVNQPSLADDKV